MSITKTLISFFSGAESWTAFLDVLISDKELEAVLKEIPSPPYASQYDSAYTLLLTLDYTDVYQIEDAKKILSKILEKFDIVMEDQVDSHIIDILSKINFSWVNVSATFLQELIVKSEHSDTSKIISEIMDIVSARFICLNKKPLWIQEPDWQYEGGEPMIFVGQFDVSSLNHDKSALYVFRSKNEKKYSCVEQHM